MTKPAPLVDDHTSDLIEGAIAELAGRWDIFMDGANTIRLIASLIVQAERCLPIAVADARDEKCSWAQIATLLGTTRKAARARFDPASPTYDGRCPFD